MVSSKKVRRDFILEFKHVDISDKPIFDDYYNEADYRGSECCFGSTFIWRGCYDTFWAISHGALILKVTVNGVTFVLPPFGGKDEDMPLIVNALKEYFGGPFVSAGGGVYLPAIIIIHSTNCEVCVELCWNSI